MYLFRDEGMSYSGMYVEMYVCPYLEMKVCMKVCNYLEMKVCIIFSYVSYMVMVCRCLLYVGVYCSF